MDGQLTAMRGSALYPLCCLHRFADVHPRRWRRSWAVRGSLLYPVSVPTGRTPACKDRGRHRLTWAFAGESLRGVSVSDRDSLSGACVVAGQQSETAARQRGDRAEVTFVERQQPPRPEPVGKNHHRKVSQPKIKGVILLTQPGHRPVLIRGQSLNPEPPCRHVAQERPGSQRAPTAADEMVHLCRHRRGHDQVAAFCTQHITDRAMEPVTGIPESDQRRGVHDQGHPPNPASRSSSGTSATEEQSPPMSLQARRLARRCVPAHTLTAQPARPPPGCGPLRRRSGGAVPRLNHRGRRWSSSPM